MYLCFLKIILISSDKIFKKKFIIWHGLEEKLHTLTRTPILINSVQAFSDRTATFPGNMQNQNRKSLRILIEANSPKYDFYL